MITKSLTGIIQLFLIYYTRGNILVQLNHASCFFTNMWTGINTSSFEPQLLTCPVVLLKTTEEARWPLEEVECWRFSIWFLLQDHLLHINTLILLAISNPVELLILSSLWSQRKMKTPEMIDWLLFNMSFISFTYCRIAAIKPVSMARFFNVRRLKGHILSFMVQEILIKIS